MKLITKFLTPTGIGLCILILFATCKTTRHSATNVSISTSAENFDEFYNKFHSDSLFQMSRIQFPLIGKSIDAKGEKNWTMENWELMRTRIFDVDTTEYKITYKKYPRQFTQKAWLEDSGFSSECRFELINKKWFLVYVLDHNL